MLIAKTAGQACCANGSVNALNGSVNVQLLLQSSDEHSYWIPLFILCCSDIRLCDIFEVSWRVWFSNLKQNPTSICLH